MQKLKTHAEARAWFDQTGTSIAEWSRSRGYGTSLVRQILEGKKPCKRGQSHQIAVLLSIKAGVITRTPADALQRKRGAATAQETGA